MIERLTLFLLCIIMACTPDTPEKVTKPENYHYLTWKELDSLKVDYYFDADYGDYLGKPSFSKSIKEWDGKMIIIEGYWIPVSEIGDSSVSVLSALPFAQCFFCSGAGIETVMQIKSDGSINRMDTDAKIKLKGKFFLNKNNPMELYYQLLDASLH